MKLIDALGLENSDFAVPEELPSAAEDRRRLLRLLARLRLEGRGNAEELREALRLLDRVAEHHAPTRGDYQLKAAILALLGDEAASGEMNSRAEDPRTPRSAEDHFLRGELLRTETAGRLAVPADEPSAAARKDRLTQALEEYRRALNLDPKHYWAQFQLGRCYLGLGRHAEAIEALGACVALRPETPWAYSARGLAYAMAGQFAEARRDLHKARALDPEFRPARLNRGVVEWLDGRAQEALAEFEAVLQPPRERRLTEAAFYRAQIYIEYGRFSQALSDLNEVAAESPAFRPVYELRARVHFEMENDQAGFDDLNLYAAWQSDRPFDPEGAEACQSRCRVLRRMAPSLSPAARARVLGRAVSEIQEALARRPAATFLWAELGAVQELRGDAPAAIQAYSRALAASPDDLQLRNQRGWAFYHAKQSDRAAADFAEVVRRAPDNAEGRAGLGYLLVTRGETQPARREAAAALLHGSHNYLILHNVACVYAELAARVQDEPAEYEDLALSLLPRAVELWLRSESGPDELALIRGEPAFRSLSHRHEFQPFLESGRSSP